MVFSATFNNISVILWWGKLYTCMKLYYSTKFITENIEKMEILTCV